jgi:hypothetical protein
MACIISPMRETDALMSRCLTADEIDDSDASVGPLGNEMGCVGYTSRQGSQPVERLSSDFLSGLRTVISAVVPFAAGFEVAELAASMLPTGWPARPAGRCWQRGGWAATPEQKRDTS